MSFDATEGVVFCMEKIISIMGYSFNLLENIKIGDTNLLILILSLFLLTALIPILFSILAYRIKRSDAFREIQNKERYERAQSYKEYVKKRNSKG